MLSTNLPDHRIDELTATRGRLKKGQFAPWVYMSEIVALGMAVVVKARVPDP